ncbi:MAG: hypothetical protein YYHSYBAR_002610 [Candidatus Fervidibacter sacchari]|jgi:hypothetical protein
MRCSLTGETEGTGFALAGRKSLSCQEGKVEKRVKMKLKVQNLTSIGKKFCQGT